MIFGERKLVPRLVAWHGDARDGVHVLRHAARSRVPWTPDLPPIRARVEELIGAIATTACC